MIDVTPRERPDEEFSASERAHLAMQVHGLLNALREMEAFADRLNAARAWRKLLHNLLMHWPGADLPPVIRDEGGRWAMRRK